MKFFITLILLILMSIESLHNFHYGFSVNKIYTKINEFTFLILKLIMYVIINNL